MIYAVAIVPKGLKVDVLPADNAGPKRATFLFARVDYGSYIYSGIRLALDEERTGFTLEGGRLRLAFHRVD